MSTKKPTSDAFDLTDAEWVKSSLSSGTGDCVELATIDGYVLVRDSKSPQHPPLVFTPAEIRAFIDAARAGEFDHLATSS